MEVSQERKNKHFEMLGELTSATDEIYNIEENICKGGIFNNKYTTKEGLTIEDFFIGEEDIYFNDGNSDMSYSIGIDIFAEDAQFLLEEILMEHYTEIE